LVGSTTGTIPIGSPLALNDIIYICRTLLYVMVEI
jgi:hypothetical protein